jgi:hypothetical protein
LSHFIDRQVKLQQQKLIVVIINIVLKDTTLLYKHRF